MSKTQELFYLNKFKENFIDFPQGDIFPVERPDFLIKTNDGIIGVEITVFYRQMASKDHPPTLQQKQNVRKGIVSLAKSIYDGKQLPPVFVSVVFDYKFYCRKRISDMQPIAERLAQLAEMSFLNSEKEKFWRFHEIKLDEVLFLTVKKMRLNESIWEAPLGNFLPTVNPEQIQNILNDKDALRAGYREKCDKIWLVIVMDRFIPSSFALIPNDITTHIFTHAFDSAFLFFYDYDETQLPPFVLRNAK